MHANETTGKKSKNLKGGKIKKGKNHKEGMRPSTSMNVEPNKWKKHREEIEKSVKRNKSR
jgi:hypothetical protein